MSADTRPANTVAALVQRLQPLADGSSSSPHLILWRDEAATMLSERAALMSAARDLLDFGHPSYEPDTALQVEAWHRLDKLVTT